MYCCVRYCKSVWNPKSNIKFHRFPKDIERRNAWLSNIPLKGFFYETATICSLHFTINDYDINRPGHLCKSAVPKCSSNFHGSSDVMLEKMCRVCLSADSKLYDMKQYNLDEPYEKITGINVTGVKYPDMLCVECAQRLLNCIRFRGKCIRGHILLTEIWDTYGGLTAQSVNSVDRHQNGLVSQLQVKHIEADHCDLYCEHTDTHTAEMAIENIREIDSDAQSNELANEDIEEIDSDAQSDEPANEDVEETDSDNVEYIIEIDSDDVDNDMTVDDFIKSITVPREPEAVLEKKPKTVLKKDLKKSEKMKALDEEFNAMFTVVEVKVEGQKELDTRKISDMYLKFTCSVCYKEFTDKVGYNNHIIRHTTKFGEYQCDVCKIYYKSKRILKLHKEVHKRKFQCKECTFVTAYRDAAENHILFHKGIKFKCPICGLEFEQRSTYFSHRRCKHPTDHVCEFCGYTYLSQNGLNYHKFRQHRLEMDKGQITSDSPLCETCNIRFYSEDALRTHMTVSDKHTNEGERRAYNELKRRRRLRPGASRQIFGHETKLANPTQIPCEQCDEVLDSHRAYHSHFRRWHRGMTRTVYPVKRGYMCEECGRRFLSAAILEEHKYVHTGERRFQCDKCEKAFTTKGNLQLHTKIHSEDRPLYDCPTCGKKFTERRNRDRHMILHTGVKAFKCNVCEKSFATSYERFTHNKYVHLKEPWPKRPHRLRKVPQTAED